MDFNISDKVLETATGIVGTITDRMFSESRGEYLYVIKPDDGGRSFMREGGKIEPYNSRIEYKIAAEVADNVVIGIIYEVENGQEYEVCRGHGHIIHEGAEGIAQACSYAFKKAFESIDTGIYFKQRRQ